MIIQEKVKKVLDIWTKTTTFSPDALKSSYAKLNSDSIPIHTHLSVHADKGQKKEKGEGTESTATAAAQRQSQFFFRVFVHLSFTQPDGHTYTFQQAVEHATNKLLHSLKGSPWLWQRTGAVFVASLQFAMHEGLLSCFTLKASMQRVCKATSVYRGSVCICCKQGCYVHQYLFARVLRSREQEKGCREGKRNQISYPQSNHYNVCATLKSYLLLPLFLHRSYLRGSPCRNFLSPISTLYYSAHIQEHQNPIPHMPGEALHRLIHLQKYRSFSPNLRLSQPA